MTSWFDIANLPIGPESNGDEAGYMMAVRRIHKMVEQLEEIYPSERILVGGFSQGGECASHVRLAITVCLACA